MTAQFDAEKFQQLCTALEQKSSDLDKYLGDVKSVAGDATKLKAFIEGGEKQAKSINDIINRLADMEQKAVDQVMQGKQAPNTIGSLLIKSDEFTSWQKKQDGKFKMEIKADPLYSPAAPTIQQDQGLIVPTTNRVLTLIDVIPSGQTTADSVRYAREESWTNNAGSQKEGATKKESKLRFKQVSSPVVTIAHLLFVSKQALDDAPQLAAYIDNRMGYGLRLEVERQILWGKGPVVNGSAHDADEYEGIMVTGNHKEFVPADEDANAIDGINTAIYDAWDSDYQPDTTVMHPKAWSKIEKTKDKQDRYIFGAPGMLVQPVLWGVPVVLTPKQSVTKFASGAFKMATQRLVRQDVTIELFEQDGDNVQKNMITVRAEERSVFQIFAPAAIVAGDLVVPEP